MDSYADFPGADLHDGRQLPADLHGNAGARFLEAPDYSAADYYDRSRARTYACCFSLENSDYIWTNYANGSARGKVGLVFDFGRLRARLNASLDPATARLMCDGVVCHQIFSVNYGVVQYVDWDRDRANAAHLSSPIQYAYMKAERFKDEREPRVSLSALGIGTFVLDDGRALEFAPSLQIPFDFRAALSDQTIRQFSSAWERVAQLLGLTWARLIHCQMGGDLMMETPLNTIPLPELGERLRAARETANFTQKDAADAIAVARTTLVAIEQGQRRARIDELQQLAKLYRTSVNAILRREAVHVDLAPRFRRLIGDNDQAATAAADLSFRCHPYPEAIAVTALLKRSASLSRIGFEPCVRQRHTYPRVYRTRAALAGRFMYAAMYTTPSSRPVSR